MKNKRLEHIVKEVFPMRDAKTIYTRSRDTIDEWDSLAQIELVTLIEKEFTIRLTVEEIRAIESLRSIDEILINRSIAIE